MKSDTEQDSRPIYLLDWESITVEIEGTECSHELRRPTVEQQTAWLESHLQPGAKSGFIKKADAKIYDEILIEARGYDGPVPPAHKSAAMLGLFKRKIILHEICRNGSISVHESFPGAVVMTHTFRAVTSKEIREFPSKAIDMIWIYDRLLESVDGVRLKNGDIPTRGQCIDLVPQLVKLKVITAFLKAGAELLADRPAIQDGLKMRRKKRRNNRAKRRAVSSHSTAQM